MNKISFILLIASVTMIISCKDYHRNPGKTYAPDMVYSVAQDYYNSTEKITAQGGSYNKMPVQGTVAREQSIPSHIGENDTLLANSNTCNIDLVASDLEEGKRLYLIYCGICHGEQLDGNGPLFASGKFAAMPANLKSGEKYLKMSEGRIYHAIVYGKNTMGSYASQLDSKQRWQVVAYIKKIQSENGGSAFTMIQGTKTVDSSAASVENKASESEKN
ncbi:MAG: cytochrome c [Chitinophagaceae bacterium]